MKKNKARRAGKKKSDLAGILPEKKYSRPRPKSQPPEYQMDRVEQPGICPFTQSPLTIIYPQGLR